MLRPGGRLILVHPNFRLNPGGYFDDFTHVAIYTDRSLPDYLVSEGWVRRAPGARFLPLTMKSRASALSSSSPVPPVAGQAAAPAQMLVVATPSASALTSPDDEDERHARGRRPGDAGRGAPGPAETSGGARDRPGRP